MLMFYWSKTEDGKTEDRRPETFTCLNCLCLILHRPYWSQSGYSSYSTLDSLVPTVTILRNIFFSPGREISGQDFVGNGFHFFCKGCNRPFPFRKQSPHPLREPVAGDINHAHVHTYRARWSEPPGHSPWDGPGHFTPLNPSVPNRNDANGGIFSGGPGTVISRTRFHVAANLYGDFARCLDFQGTLNIPKVFVVLRAWERFQLKAYSSASPYQTGIRPLLIRRIVNMAAGWVIEGFAYFFTCFLEYPDLVFGENHQKLGLSLACQVRKYGVDPDQRTIFSDW